ncbi:MAG: 16S rRNA (guanine(527)-N(7))-methyltransferase RsmG [Acidobacteriaceae bacterium]
MGNPSEARIAELLRPYIGSAEVPVGLYGQLSTYLELLTKWNARTNLTAIREPEEIVRRHFGESLFAGLQIGSRQEAGATLLDFGSGAGFPGLPIQLLRPEMRVTLAESQGKKASFLREVVRTLGLTTEVWAGRVEAMPEAAGAARQFDSVTLRAVDNMEKAMMEARLRVRSGGWLVALTTEMQDGVEGVRLPEEGPGWVTMEQVGYPTGSAISIGSS